MAECILPKKKRILPWITANGSYMFMVDVQVLLRHLGKVLLQNVRDPPPQNRPRHHRPRLLWEPVGFPMCEAKVDLRTVKTSSPVSVPFGILCRSIWPDPFFVSLSSGDE